MSNIILHIGFSKCASTWLQSYFKNIPNVYYREKTGFFNFNNKEKEFIQSYESFFESSSADSIRIESDEHIILPDYNPVLKSHGTTLKNVDKVIAKINNSLSNVKIILVIRNQYDLIVSRYSQYVIGGGSLNFKDFVEEMLNSSYDNINYYQNYYAEIIERLYSEFGKDNVLIILQEHLKQREEYVKRSLAKYFGVNDTNISFNVRNIINQRKGLSLIGLSVLRFFNKLLVIRKASLNAPVKAIIPSILYVNIIIRGVRVIDYYLPQKIKKSKKRMLDDNIINKLKAIFHEDNEKLCALLGKNLKSYGYI